MFAAILRNGDISGRYVDPENANPPLKFPLKLSAHPVLIDALFEFRDTQLSGSAEDGGPNNPDMPLKILNFPKDHEHDSTDQT